MTKGRLPRSREDAERLMAALATAGGIANLANSMGIAKRNADKHLAAARKILKEAGAARKANPGFTLPEFPAAEEHFEDTLIKHLIPATDKKIKHELAKEWFSIKVNKPGPFMYLLLGDQHIDDPYCNLRLLYEHITIARAHDNIFVLPMGDLHNNWVGRLQRLYADQEMSREQAYKGIKWLLTEAGMNIPLILLGNHDMWEQGKEILNHMLQNETMIVADWRAKFKLVCPNGREVLIDAAHDHKGHSMYNALHAQKRAAMFGRKAHVFIGAHRHTPGITKDWWGEERVTTWYVRCGSYKYFDMHAVTNGFPNYMDAPAMALIIDPESPNNNPIVHVTDDIPMAVRMLDMLRG